MDGHLQVRLHNGFATVSRLVARLHALGVDVEEFHVNGDQMCLHLAHASAARRVETVLQRCADATVDTTATCLKIAGPHQPRHTRYVVWSQPAGPADEPGRRPRISA